MSDYNRLTNNNIEEYDPEYDFCMGCEFYGKYHRCDRPNGICANFERFIETYNRLAELEDKIENGTLVELPCKVGDTVYVIDYYEIKEYLVSTICIDDNNEVFLELERNHHLLYQYPYNVWFTKPEAEAKLRELKGEV